MENAYRLLRRKIAVEVALRNLQDGSYRSSFVFSPEPYFRSAQNITLYATLRRRRFLRRTIA